MAKVNKAKTAVDSATTLAQQSSAKLERSVQSLVKIAEELGGLTDTNREITEEIGLKQAQLGQLGIDYKEKERELKLDLSMRAKEEGERLVSEILEGDDRVAIATDELTELKNELSTLKSDFDSKLKSEVAKTISVISERHDSAIRTKELEFKAETAVIEAQLSTEKEKVGNLNDQISEYKEIISEERKARIEEAKARGGEKVTITNAK